MKTFLALAFTFGIAGLASATPYLVYSGDVLNNDLSAAGKTRTETRVYVVTDIANTSVFDVMLVDISTKAVRIISRPSASPSASEADENFFGGMTRTDGTGSAVLSFNDQTSDAAGNVFVTRFFCTGALVMKNTPLVPGRKIPQTVTLTSNGIATGTATFNLISTPASSGTMPFGWFLGGAYFSYEIGADGTIPHAGTATGFFLAQDSLLTKLANIGGPVTVGGNTSALGAVTIPAGTTDAEAYTAWLAAFAQAEGYVVPGSGGTTTSGGSGLTITGTGTTGTTGTTGGSTGGGTITIGSGGTSGGGVTSTGGGTITIGGGTVSGGTTTTLGGGNTYSGGTTISTGTLSTGSSTAGTTTTTGSLTLNTGTGTLTLGSATNVGGSITGAIGGSTLTLTTSGTTPSK